MQVQDSTLNFALSSKGTISDAGLTNPTGEEEANAIDSNSKTKWLVYQSTGMLTYTFNSTTSSNKLNCYAITSANDSSDRDPKSWKLEGSTDGTNWTTLDTQTNITFSNRYEREVFRFTNDCNYKYYRLNITANNGSSQYTQLADFELMMVAGDQIDYAYDEDGNLYGFYYNGIPYIYVRNGQNDITGILDSNGNQVVSYEYDSWGKVISVTGSMASTIGERNPFRYRGYYYDTETGLFYVGSRYYDPNTCRFLNADNQVETNEELLGTNVFAYCDNNPIMLYDPDGYDGQWIDLGKGWKARFDAANTSTQTQRHVHVCKDGEEYAQNKDGSPHDGSSGKPPKSVIKKLKEKTDWDWNKKAKAYDNNPIIKIKIINDCGDVVGYVTSTGKNMYYGKMGYNKVYIMPNTNYNLPSFNFNYSFGSAPILGW